MGYEYVTSPEQRCHIDDIGKTYLINLYDLSKSTLKFIIVINYASGELENVLYLSRNTIAKYTRQFADK